eukprot:3020755-Lingulodinium_polyedra.AAC.1
MSQRFLALWSLQKSKSCKWKCTGWELLRMVCHLLATWKICSAPSVSTPTNSGSVLGLTPGS